MGGSVCGQPLTNDAEGIQELAAVAAEQGDPLALAIAGQIYEHQTGKIDLVRASGWYTLAAGRGMDKASDDAARVAGKLSAENLSRAKQLAEDLGNKTPNAVLLGPSCSPAAPTPSTTASTAEKMGLGGGCSSNDSCAAGLSCINQTCAS